MQSFRKIHRWLGLTLCLILLSISCTGVILIWKKEYLWLNLPQAREVINNNHSSLSKAIDHIQSNYAEGQITRIDLYVEDLALHKVFLTNDSYAWHDQQGAKIQQWRSNERFEDWLLDLHHRFLLDDVGLNIAGFSGLLLMALVILGIFIWWPIKHQLKKGLLPNKQQWRELNCGALIRSHGNIGAIFSIPILIISITGVILIYPYESKNLLVDYFVPVNDYQDHEITDQLDTLYGPDEGSWQRVIERSLDLHPNARLHWLLFSDSFNSYKIVGLQQANGWNTTGKTEIYIEPKSGYMDFNTNALKKSNAERLYNFSYPLHSGKLGFWHKLLMTFIGTSLFFISFIGVTSYFKRLRGL